MVSLFRSLPTLVENQFTYPRLPEQNPTKADVDHLFAKSLNDLELKERENVLYDIHGVSEVMQEDPEFIAQRLHELDLDLQKCPHKQAYETAKSLSKDYVGDRKFRLKFLRATNYDSKKAANRIAMHFETKLELFGKDKLVRDILLSDLDQDLLQSGYLQFLPQRDRAGRALLFTHRGALPSSATILARVSFVSVSETTQLIT